METTLLDVSFKRWRRGARVIKDSAIACVAFQKTVKNVSTNLPLQIMSIRARVCGMKAAAPLRLPSHHHGDSTDDISEYRQQDN